MDNDIAVPIFIGNSRKTDTVESGQLKGIRTVLLPRGKLHLGSDRPTGIRFKDAQNNPNTFQVCRLCLRANGGNFV